MQTINMTSLHFYSPEAEIVREMLKADSVKTEVAFMTQKTNVAVSGTKLFSLYVLNQ